MRRRPLLWVALALAAACGDAQDASFTPSVWLAVNPSADHRVGDRVEIQASMQGVYGSLVTYHWSAQLDGTPVVLTREASDKVSFRATRQGDYHIVCLADVEGHEGTFERRISVLVAPIAVEPAHYLVQVRPPPGSGLSTLQRRVLVLAESLNDQVWQLEQARPVAVTIKHGTRPLAAFVHPWTATGGAAGQVYLPEGRGEVSLGEAEGLLVIPDAPDVAPLIVPRGQQGALEVDVQTQPQLAIEGTVEGQGQPLKGATVAVLLDDGGREVPSSLGVVDPGGSYRVFARKGRVKRLTVVPEEASELPAASVSADLALEKSVSSWRFDYDAKPAGPLSITIQDKAGKPVSGARVTMRADLAEVATLTIGTTVFPAFGKVSRSALTDERGVLSGAPLSLLPGKYALDVVPADPALSRLSLQAEVGRQESLLLVLEPRLALQGNVAGRDAVPVRASIELIDERGGRLQQNSAADGSFRLTVDRAVPYRMRIRPLDTVVGLGTLLQNVAPLERDGDLEQLTLPQTVSVSGRIFGVGGAVVSGALISVLRCDGAACSPWAIVEEVRSTKTGSFELKLPRGDPL